MAPTVRQRAASPGGPRQGAAPAAEKPADAAKGQSSPQPVDKSKAPPVESSSGSGLGLPFWIALLCLTQIAMFIYTKRAAQKAALPLSICLAQFAVSACLTAMASALPGTGWNGLRWMKKEQRQHLVPLGIVWSLAFVLLTASIASMSAALAGVVRSTEPLVSVALGLAAGERYSLPVLAALVPVCAGVVLASHGGGSLTLAGVALAVFSNFGFSARPFLARRLRSQPGEKLDEIGTFFHVTCIATVLLLLAAGLVEGGQLLPTAQRLDAAGEGGRFLGDVLLSSVSFFLYQFAQLVVMSRLNPLTFSVLTPVSKASMIVACALYFGDPFGASNALGVGISTAGVLLFSAAKRRADGQKAKAAAGKAE